MNIIDTFGESQNQEIKAVFLNTVSQSSLHKYSYKMGRIQKTQMDKKESTFLTDVVKTANIKKKEVVKSKTGNIQFIEPFYFFVLNFDFFSFFKLISSKICLLDSIKVKRQTFLEINVALKLFHCIVD